MCVRTINAPSLACYTCHTLSTNNDILLASACDCGQGDIVRPTNGTPTPNGLSYSWDFLLGRLPYMLAGLDGKLYPLIPF